MSFINIGKMLSFDFSKGDVGDFIKKFKELNSFQQIAILSNSQFTMQQKQLLATSAGLTITESGQVVATTELAASQTAATASTTGLEAAMKALWATMKPILTNPITWVAAIAAATVALEDLFTIDYGEAQEALNVSTSE